MASDTDIAPATVCDLMDMIESRYSGQITPRDLDVAKVAFAAGAAAERERIRQLAISKRAVFFTCPMHPCPDPHHHVPFADLLDGAQ